MRIAQLFQTNVGPSASHCFSRWVSTYRPAPAETGGQHSRAEREAV